MVRLFIMGRRRRLLFIVGEKRLPEKTIKMDRPFRTLGRSVHRLCNRRADKSGGDCLVGTRDLKIPPDMITKDFDLVADLVGTTLSEFLGTVGGDHDERDFII